MEITMTFVWDDDMHNKCKRISSHMVSLKPCEDQKSGLRNMKQYVVSLFKERGFEVIEINNSEAEYRPIIIATLKSNKNTTIGFFGHYDVENVSESKWSTNPWKLTEVNGRWQARGVADNIVPLVQRILLSPTLKKSANLVFVLQGEEEIGSPFAMEKYSELALPKIDLWIEETGYFYKNGDHRIMAMNADKKLEKVFEALEILNRRDNRGTKVRNRPMNKAFGNQGCPCLVHLVKDTPYVALGPNDDFSTIHGVDESINPDLLSISASQIAKAVEVFSN